jgi:5-methylcytosine-specific restriction protein A
MMEKATLPLKIRQPIFERDNYICWYCGKDTRPFIGKAVSHGTPSVDHITPLSKGGGHEADNLRTACMSCNMFKRRMTVEEFRAYMLRRTSPTARAREALLIALTELLEIGDAPRAEIMRAVEWCDSRDQPYVFWGEWR